MRPSLLTAIVLTLALAARADDPKGGPEEFKRLKFRNVGPACGGRVSRACGVPGDPLTYYAATAGGGVWKSSDGGVNWQAITDDMPLHSVGSLAVAPSDPNVIYAGAGEANIRGNVLGGNGIYRSTDAGKTWQHVWKQAGQIGTLIVHPTNADIAFAAVLGKAFGPNEERGVFRTLDGGKSWQRVLFKDRDTGASDVAFDPTNPRVLFAGTWQARRSPWDLTSGGPGSGLHTSTDGGTTWTQLVAKPEDPIEAAKEPAKGKRYAEGLPEGIWGKVCVAISASNNQRIYALIEAEKGGLFRSDDGGKTWDNVNDSRALRQRAWYFSTLTVHPTNADTVYFPQVPLLKSVDGGKTLQRVKGPHHGDHHDIWLDPKNPERIIDSNDGGVDISTNGGKTWLAPALPIGQAYRVSCDNAMPYRVMAAFQDIGTARGPSNSLTGDGIELGQWETVGGGEAGHVVPDPSNPKVVWAGEYAGIITRYDDTTRQARMVTAWPFDPSGFAPSTLKYRYQWTAPILVSKHDPKVVYHGANVVFRTTNGGLRWEEASKDLTRNDKTKQQWAGGPITGDNTGVEVYGTVFALAESPLKAGLLWAGSDDGLVHVSRDHGKNWTDVTKFLPGLPEFATVQCIEPSPHHAETAYLAAQNYRLDDVKPYVYKTTDGGKTWKPLAGLPTDQYTMAVREDSKAKGHLYVGTNQGVWFSPDDGQTWQHLKLNLPTVAVPDLKVHGDDLVVATVGRSLWILTDLTPLRAWSVEKSREAALLYPPLPATLWGTTSTLSAPFALKASVGANPPEGAILHYSLGKKVEGELLLEVLAGTKVIATLTSKKQEEYPENVDPGSYSGPPEPEEPLSRELGLHRVVWNLRHDGPSTIRGARADYTPPRHGPRVAPGEYKVRLTAGGTSMLTTLLVGADPRIGPVLAADLKAQEQFLLGVTGDLTRLTKAVEQMRAVRKQIEARHELLKDEKALAPLVEAGKGVLTKLDKLEEQFHNPKAKVSYDILAMRGGAQLYSQLIWYLATIEGTDGPVPEGVGALVQEKRAELNRLEKEWRDLLADDLKRLNEQAQKLEVPGLILPR